jgi:hypothetical protein
MSSRLYITVVATQDHEGSADHPTSSTSAVVPIAAVHSQAPSPGVAPIFALDTSVGDEGAGVEELVTRCRHTHLESELPELAKADVGFLPPDDAVGKRLLGCCLSQFSLTARLAFLVVGPNLFKH